MRPSFVLSSAVAAVVVMTAGAVWADAARRHTVPGRPAAIGATGALTSTAPVPSTSQAPSTTTPPPRPSTKHTAKASAATSAAGGVAGDARHPVSPYRPPTTHRAVAHGSCSGSSPSGASAAEAAVFTLLNQERAANGLCPMRWSSLLQTSARRHSALMDQKGTAADCSDGNYSHRYSGEPDIDTRIFATGYPRGPVAEAIGCSPDPSTDGALSLQQLMYNEKPPANQHREMILSSIVDHVGIAIVIDSRDGTLWLTEDYGS